MLERGYAVVRGAGAPVVRAAGVAPGAALAIEFADGEVRATASGRPAGPGPAAPKPRPAAAGGQGDLF